MSESIDTDCEMVLARNAHEKAGNTPEWGTFVLISIICGYTAKSYLTTERKFCLATHSHWGGSGTQAIAEGCHISFIIILAEQHAQKNWLMTYIVGKISKQFLHHLKEVIPTEYYKFFKIITINLHIRVCSKGADCYIYWRCIHFFSVLIRVS